MESYRSLLVRLPSPDQTYDAYHKLEQMVKIVKAIPKVVKYNMWEMRASRAYQRLEEYYYICSCEYQHPSNNRECVYS